jgi:hypothetical protein
MYVVLVNCERCIYYSVFSTSRKILPYFFNDGSSSTACLHQYWDGMCTRGGMGRRSLEALTLKMTTARTPTTTPAIAVLRFHWGGLLHQPPAGDQTYFGW